MLYTHIHATCDTQKIANILKIYCRLQPTIVDVIFFGPDCPYDPTRPKRSKKPHDRSLFRSLFLATAGATAQTSQVSQSVSLC